MYETVAEVVGEYQGVLLDAFGVFWGGNAYGVLPGAKEAMAKLVAEGKIVGVLSNATQLSEREKEKLHKHGIIEGEHYHFYLTSGDCTRDLIFQDLLPFPTPKKKFWTFGGNHPRYPSHQALFEGSIYTEAKTVEEADFIYIAIPHIDGEDRSDPEEFRPLLAHLRDTVDLPMVCANCDLFVHEGNPPKLVVRQGTIARLYEEMGGKVFYVGKPWPFVYECAMRKFMAYGIQSKQQVLMVGDTPETDIRGAIRFAISAALITETGVMGARRTPPSDLLDSDQPHYFIKRLG